MNCGLVAIVIATVICSSLASTDVIVRFKISLDAMESFEGQPRHHIRAALGNHATNAQIRAISLVENYSLDYQSFWLDNSLAVTQAPPALIEALEALEEVCSPPIFTLLTFHHATGGFCDRGRPGLPPQHEQSQQSG